MTEDERLLRLMEPIAPEGFHVWTFAFKKPGVAIMPKGTSVHSVGVERMPYGSGPSFREAVQDCLRRYQNTKPLDEWIRTSKGKRFVWNGAAFIPPLGLAEDPPQDTST